MPNTKRNPYLFARIMGSKTAAKADEWGWWSSEDGDGMGVGMGKGKGEEKGAVMLSNDDEYTSLCQIPSALLSLGKKVGTSSKDDNEFLTTYSRRSIIPFHFVSQAMGSYLYWAIHESDQNVVTRLLKGANLSYQDNNRRATLDVARDNSHIISLLEKGADTGVWEFCEDEEMRWRALDEREKVLGPGYPDTPKPPQNLSRIQDQGRLNGASSFSRRSSRPLHVGAGGVGPRRATCFINGLEPTIQSDIISGGHNPQAPSPSSTVIEGGGSEDKDNRGMEDDCGDIKAGSNSDINCQSRRRHLEKPRSYSPLALLSSEDSKGDISAKGHMPHTTTNQAGNGGDGDESSELTAQGDATSSDTLSGNLTPNTVLGRDHEGGEGGDENESESELEDGDDETETSSEGSTCCSLAISPNQTEAENIKSCGDGDGEKGKGKANESISRKRSAPQDFTSTDRSNGDGQDDGESPRRHSKRPKKDKGGQNKSPDQSKKPFTCPYFKKNPVKYGDCAEWFGSKLSQVKEHCILQHLKRRCPRCKIFQGTQEDIDQHLGDENCEKPENPDPEEEKMAKEKITHVNKAKTWERIYEVLFPLYIPDPFPQSLIEVLIAPIDDDELPPMDRVRTAASLHEQLYRLDLAKFLKDRLGLGDTVDGLLDEYNKGWTPQTTCNQGLPDDVDNSEMGPHNTAVRGPPTELSETQKSSTPGPIHGSTISEHGSQPLLSNNNTIIDAGDQPYDQVINPPGQDPPNLQNITWGPNWVQNQPRCSQAPTADDPNSYISDIWGKIENTLVESDFLEPFLNPGYAGEDSS